jgi:hypothetical protein
MSWQTLDKEKLRHERKATSDSKHATSLFAVHFEMYRRSLSIGLALWPVGVRGHFLDSEISLYPFASSRGSEQVL